jgi:plasmid maintenance system antidote protein VapI
MIAARSGYSEAYISLLLSGDRRASKWETAQRLARATGTKPELWLEASPDAIRWAVTKAMERIAK